MTVIPRIPFPGELPRDFRNQYKRHKEYKRRGPQSGSRHPDSPVTTRIKLSSRFDAEAPTSSVPPTSPKTQSPPPSLPPQTPSSVPPAPILSTAATSRRAHKRKATGIASSRRRRRRKSENLGPRTQELVAIPSPGRPATGEPESRAET